MISFKKFITEGVYDPTIFKAIFLAGGPGSGKSYVAGKTTTGNGFRTVNSDDVFEYLLTKNGLSHDLLQLNPEEYDHAMELRDKAKATVKAKTKLLMQGRVGLVVDGTGKDFNKIKTQADRLKSMGYDCYMIFVNTSLDTAQARNLKRARSVKPSIVEDSWHQVQDNIGKFQNYFGANNMLIIDNNDNSDKEDIDIAWKKIDKFADRPVKNKIALDWIAQELEDKKR